MRFSAATPDGSIALGPVQLEPAPWRTCAPRRALAHAVRNLDAAVAEGGARAEEEAARGGLAHAAHNVLRKILRVELVDALDDRLHELPG